MKKLLLVLVALLGATSCVHVTSMSDPALKDLWKGQPLDTPAIETATKKWPKDVALIEMQQAFALLKKGDLTPDGRARAKRYLEKAVMTFDDLKLPNNFSTAFTADANTPYRGRPYERVLASAMLGILDVADGRCDMGLPSFKNAEYLDARWQPFQFGSDAPLVYALSLRCLHQMKASPSDIQRAKDGLYRSVRLIEALDDVRASFDPHGKDLENQPITRQITFLILDAGLSSALMEADEKATPTEILDQLAADSVRYYLQVLRDKNDVMHEVISPYALKLEKELGSKATAPSAPALTRVTNAMKELIAAANSNNKLATLLERKIANAQTITKAVSDAVTKPKATFVFDGKGPKIVAEGNYNEVAKVVPASEALAKPSVEFIKARAHDRCGLSRTASGALNIVLCDDDVLRKEKPTDVLNMPLWSGAKLWSSSYQATSMAGRRFDKVLRGRAQFRMGAETTALIAGAAALALLSSGNALAEECRMYGRNCEAAKNAQLAGAIAGLFAGGAWLVGRASNPEADTRHLTDTFESGYLMLKRED